ncbi:MAG: GTPase Era [Kangiellaceae bacterium]|nr:GTPase Era [Kangiellaceae bacterium]|tara:strand:+ start:2028 stop:2930 length:903 start_codon:yes stop_codon:yes gene_type:complete
MTDSQKTKFGYVAIVGRPNVGKSTLLNAFLGQKLSITCRKPQTTRHRIHGILTDNEHQIVFVDTPGIHQSTRQMNRLMNRAAHNALSDVDAILFVVESGKWLEEDQRVFQIIKESNKPTLVVVNKVDRPDNRNAVLPFIEQLAEVVTNTDIVPVSALKRDNIQQLQQLIYQMLPYGEFGFDEDDFTDRSARFLAAEIIREKLMRLMGDEVPYATAVEVERFEMVSSDRAEINAVILVERAGQKPIVLGKSGSMIKRIGQEARLDMNEMFGYRVHLELWVKVRDNWSDDIRALKSLGYDES